LPDSLPARELPAALQRLVAEEALDRIDADRLVELRAIARVFARVVADPAHDRRQRVVLDRRATPLRSRRSRRGYSQPWMFSPAGQRAVARRQRSR
jgi:hypothetical protein